MYAVYDPLLITSYAHGHPAINIKHCKRKSDVIDRSSFREIMMYAHIFGVVSEDIRI